MSYMKLLGLLVEMASQIEDKAGIREAEGQRHAIKRSVLKRPHSVHLRLEHSTHEDIGSVHMDAQGVDSLV